MIASLINAAAVLIGTLIGVFSRNFVRKREDVTKIIYMAIGMISLVLGIMMALKTQRILYFAISVVFGAITGQLLKIETGIERFGSFLHRLIPVKSDGDDNPARAFLDASVLFCVGSMTILGAIQAGVEGSYAILLTKSVMDGVMAILLTTALGWGVGLSVVTIIVYQGGLTLAAVALSSMVTDVMLSEISAVGGVMIMGIGFSLLGIKKIPAGNFLPAIIFALIFAILDPWIPGVLRS